MTITRSQEITDEPMNVEDLALSRSPQEITKTPCFRESTFGLRSLPSLSAGLPGLGPVGGGQWLALPRALEGFAMGAWGRWPGASRFSWEA